MDYHRDRNQEPLPSRTNDTERKPTTKRQLNRELISRHERREVDTTDPPRKRTTGRTNTKERSPRPRSPTDNLTKHGCLTSRTGSLSPKRNRSRKLRRQRQLRHDTNLKTTWTLFKSGGGQGQQMGGLGDTPK